MTVTHCVGRSSIVSCQRRTASHRRHRCIEVLRRRRRFAALEARSIPRWLNHRRSLASFERENLRTSLLHFEEQVFSALGIKTVGRYLT